MNILASYNWLREYMKTNFSSEDFAREMSLKGMSVESSDHLRGRFERMVIGMVKEVKPHPNADRLKIVATDIGAEVVDIVCGGVNVAQGMRVLVALPGARVHWHGEGDLIEMKEAEIRGVKSFGMICAPAEVGFDKASVPEHGIWDLTDLTSAAAGTPFVQALDMDDVIFDIEVTSNRPDAMSIVGLAREGAAATGSEFIFDEPPAIVAGSGKNLDVRVEDSDLCPRYMAVVIDGVKVGPSPAWVQKKLLLSGHRPINNIVDITNLVLHEYGQPLHAFDYDALDGGAIVVRRAKSGEKIEALDGKEYTLAPEMLVIADGAKPVAVAGVMGGEKSGTKEGTHTIVFEAAAFDAVSVRRTARSLNLYSDSQLLFEKGLSVEVPALALRRAVELALEVAGGKVASAVIDERREAYAPKVFPFDADRARALIGVEISDSEMETSLTKLGFAIQKESDHKYRITVPFWRDHDIEDEVDFSEEIARMYGYHRLPSDLPQGAPPKTLHDAALAWEEFTANFFATLGYTQLYGYSFISEQMLTRYDLDPAEALALNNPLSSDLVYMRPSLMPSLLTDIEQNQGHTPSACVFDLNRVYIPSKGDLPTEKTELVVARFGVADVEVEFLKLKGALALFAQKTGLTLRLERLDDSPYWHASRSAKIFVNDAEVGVIGQVGDHYQKAFGINRAVIAMQIDFDAIAPSLREARHYEPIPEFPAIVRDVSVIVDQAVEFAQLDGSIREQSELVESVELVEVYRGAGIDDGKKSVTLSVTLRAANRTLASSEADSVMNNVRAVLKERMNGILR